MVLILPLAVLAISAISVMMGYLAGSGMPPGDTFGFLVSTIGSSFSALTLPASFSSLGDPGPVFIYLLDGKVYDSGGSGGTSNSGGFGHGFGNGELGMETYELFTLVVKLMRRAILCNWVDDGYCGHNMGEWANYCPSATRSN